MNIDKNNLPKHIGVIMDGNGRWAKKVGKVRTFGHKFGVETVRTAISYCSKMGIEVLTLYAFSTENWKRPQGEVNVLMNLISEYLLKETPELKKQGVVLNFIGDLSKLPQKALDSIEDSINKTKDNNGLIVNIAINYGGRSEIAMAVRNIVKDALMNNISAEQITEELISDSLYTKGQPDPDLIIRTGGEVRLSNFLTWQSAYSELYFTDILWPDFKDDDFDDAILYFQKRSRRFGGLNLEEDSSK